MRCSFRCLDIPKHFCLLSPNIPSIVLSGVKNCLFSGSWELVVEYMVLEFLAEEIKYLQVLLLEVRPQLLDHLGPRHLQKVPMWKGTPERPMHTCSPFLVPMILASSGEMLRGICSPVSFFSVFSAMLIDSKLGWYWMCTMLFSEAIAIFIKILVGC